MNAVRTCMHINGMPSSTSPHKQCQFSTCHVCVIHGHCNRVIIIKKKYNESVYDCSARGVETTCISTTLVCSFAPQKYGGPVGHSQMCAFTISTHSFCTVTRTLFLHLSISSNICPSINRIYMTELFASFQGIQSHKTPTCRFYCARRP